MGSKDSDTSYYQWVVFMLFIHGVLFMLPSLMWNYLEGGLMADFGTEAKSALVTADPNTLEQRLDTYTKHFKSLGTAYKNHYLASYLLCWLLNVAATVLNFVLANQFLDEKFASYGMDVIRYYRKDIEKRSNEMNPLCNAFPTKVRCEIATGAVTGSINWIKPLCLLNQNIINQKIYLALWFVIVALLVVAALVAIYWVAVFTTQSLRAGRLEGMTKKGFSVRGNIHSVAARQVACKSTVGEWFILIQLGSNCNSYFFRKLINKMELEMECNNGTMQMKPLLESQNKAEHA